VSVFLSEILPDLRAKIGRKTPSFFELPKEDGMAKRSRDGVEEPAGLGC
jgi:hypothetical protein